ncbi:hypothetical protein B0T17DRAFT_602180 [Bombardia bombarda]|uniref:Uncharacterized protein n=1 Tax=Bombardia bombarda TaxID=252184 RepID=A0AA40BVF1_9PEZI|nr:hypothetical protein B0T17DRAFT_602180 [Bombardia bombarda]
MPFIATINASREVLRALKLHATMHGFMSADVAIVREAMAWARGLAGGHHSHLDKHCRSPLTRSWPNTTQSWHAASCSMIIGMHNSVHMHNSSCTRDAGTGGVQGVVVKYAEASNHSSQWVGNVGCDDNCNRPVLVEKLIAKDYAKHGGGTLSHQAAKDFFSPSTATGNAN